MISYRSFAMHSRPELAYRVTPKSGPFPTMRTVLDATRATSRTLSLDDLKKPHWRDAGWARIRALDVGGAPALNQATATLVRTLEQEGWFGPGAGCRERRVTRPACG